jgi:L-seryl-tRNA(Ser) seleniumtransferase
MTTARMTEKQREHLRMLPSVDRMITELRARTPQLLATVPHEIVTLHIRAELDIVRDTLSHRPCTDDELAALLTALPARIHTRLEKHSRPSLRPVINATGVVLHTNLGRSCLAEPAMEAVADAARNYSTLEYDVETGRRGSRQEHCEALLKLLTGAEAALVVNNNAAAVMLVFSAFAREKEVIVSRGELIEIGGSFRIPDIIEQTGARLVEVGTTNRTRLSDYERACGEQTALLAKIHPSNYQMVGFTESVEAGQLAALARERGIPLFEDQGSGVLFESVPGEGLCEATVGHSVAAGCDMVSFSGDKMLGGPQAGLIVGTAACIERLKSHPFARCVRPDKLTLAALEATLRLSLDEQEAFHVIPTLHMLRASRDELRPRAEELARRLAASLHEGDVDMELREDCSMVGGGALPMCELPTWVVALRPLRGQLNDMEAWLRTRPARAVVGRTHDGRFLLDVRTLRGAEDFAGIVSGVSSYFAGLAS